MAGEIGPKLPGLYNKNNITNREITTAPALILPASQISGTIAVANGGTGVSAMPAFAAYNSVSTNCVAAAFTKIALQTEDYDTANCFDSTTNYRFTPNKAGKYIVSYSVFWASANLVAGTQYNASLHKNGASIKYGSLSNVVTTNGNSVGSYLVDMNGTTDYIEMYGFNGNAINAIATNAASVVTFMSAGWVCP